MRSAAVSIVLALPALAGASDDVVVGGNRPAVEHVPPGYVAGVPMPLLIALHGYSGDGDGIESYMKFRPVADARGFLYAHPDGRPLSHLRPRCARLR